MPAPHYLRCRRCLRRRGGCLRPIIYNACGACGEKEGACAPLFKVPAVPAAKSRVPAPHYLQCLRCLWRKGGCLRPILYNACGACGEEEGACAPLFTMPAVPAAKRRVPAPHYLQCLRCLQRRVECQRPFLYNACGACGEEEGACAPSFTMPAAPAATKRMLALQHSQRQPLT